MIRFPRISNFTDFDVFENFPGVSLRYVEHAGHLETPDLIFLPGSKNTMEDLRWFRESGLETAVLKARSCSGSAADSRCWDGRSVIRREWRPGGACAASVCSR